MSRRSRRRGTTGKQGWLGMAALGLIVAGVVAAGILYATVRGYLYSDAFRRFLSVKVSEAAEVDGEFTPFRWDGLAVDSDAFEAEGKGILKGLRVDGLHTEVSVGGLSRGVWEIRGSRMQRLELALDATTNAVAAAQHAGKKIPRPTAKDSGWLPHEVDLRGVDVREVVVKALFDQGPLAASGMRMRVEPVGKKRTYQFDVADGTLRLPFGLVPALRLQRARLRYQDGQVFLKNSTAAAWQDGRVDMSGEWNMVVGQFAFEGRVSGVKCQDLFNEDWSKRCVGDISTDFTLDNHAASPVGRGHLTVRQATLTALPVLDALAAYADTRRFRVLTLSEAHTTWRWQNTEVFLSDLVLASEGLARLEGNLYIRDRELDGTFRLGLAPGTLSTIPGAETTVFQPGERGLLWTPLRITGTLDNPQEDLSDRLTAAAGQRMFDVIPETGEKVLKFTRSMLGDSPNKALDQGVKILGEGSKTVLDATTGILDGLLGGGRPPQPVPQPEPEPPKEPAPK